MPVDIESSRNAVADPGLPEDFIITKPAFIQAHIKPGDFMRSVVDPAMDRLIAAIHKPVMTGGVHLNKLTLPRPFQSRFMRELFLSRPGTRRLEAGIQKHLADHMIRHGQTMAQRKLLAEGSERSIRPELPIEPDDFCTKLIRVFLFLIDKPSMAINKSGLALFQIFVFEDKNGLS